MSNSTFDGTVPSKKSIVLQEWQPQEVVKYFDEAQRDITLYQAQKLCEFGEFLQQKNATTNLTALTDKVDIIQKHFLDSAYVADFVPTDATLCDIGCGAGFPSVVVKIFRDDVKITAVDSIGKKTKFVEKLLQRLDLSGEVKNIRAEDLAKTHREFFDAVCARAVAPLVSLLEYLAPLVKVGGLVIAQKGRDYAREAVFAQYASAVLGLTRIEERVFNLPDGDVRAILVYKKVLPTPVEFPRGQNSARKSPILPKEYEMQNNKKNKK